MNHFDISQALTYVDGLPRPNWEVIAQWIEQQPEADREDAWNDVARQWLEQLNRAAGYDYTWCEGKHTLVLGPSRDGLARVIAANFDESFRLIVLLLPDIARLPTPGKLIVLVWKSDEDYYRYVDRYLPDGDIARCHGYFLQEGHAHVALWHLQDTRTAGLTSYFAARAALAHRSLPAWIVEGLAGMLDGDLSGLPPTFSPSAAAENRRYWQERGLTSFWNGEAFSPLKEGSSHAGVLAEILLRILFADHRPGLFSRDKQRRVFAFLAEAASSDAGRAAAERYLDYGLDELAAKFLGPME